jgi:hypothetical protein
MISYKKLGISEPSESADSGYIFMAYRKSFLDVWSRALDNTKELFDMNIHCNHYIYQFL